MSTKRVRLAVAKALQCLTQLDARLEAGHRLKPESIATTVEGAIGSLRSALAELDQVEDAFRRRLVNTLANVDTALDRLPAEAATEAADG